MYSTCMVMYSANCLQGWGTPQSVNMSIHGSCPFIMFMAGLSYREIVPYDMEEISGPQPYSIIL